MTSVIDRDKAIDLLNKALEVKSPDHVQGACYYLTVEDENSGYKDGERPWSRFGDADREPKPGCLVGTALFLHDKEALVKTIREDGFNGEVITNDQFLAGLEKNGIEIEADALHIFDLAQRMQDGRHETSENLPWGVAVRRATV